MREETGMWEKGEETEPTLGNPRSPLLWSADGSSPAEESFSTWSAYTGQTTAAMQDWQWLDALHPADRAGVREAWDEATRCPHPITISYRIFHAHSGYWYFKVLHVPLFNEEHQLQAWLVFFLENPVFPQWGGDENWEIQSMYGIIFTQAVLGIFCLSLDGMFLRANAQLSHLTGYTEKELLHLSIWQLSTLEDLHLHLQAMRELLINDRCYPPFRARYLRKDGQIIWVRVTQFLVRHPSSEPYYFFFVVEDINAQVQSEAEHAQLLARVQEEHNEAVARSRQLEAVFNSLTDGVMVCDKNGEVIQSNAALHSLLHLDACPNFLQLPTQQRTTLLTATDEQGNEIQPGQWPLTRLLRGERLLEGREEDVRLTLPDGQQIYVNYSGTTMRDEKNEIIGAVLIIHDINERHLLENRIRKSFRILLALAEELVDLPERNCENIPLEELAHSLLTPGPSFRAAGEYLTALTCQMLEYQGVSICQINPDTDILHMVAISGSTRENRTEYYQRYGRIPLEEILGEDEIDLLRNNEVVIKDLALHVRDNNIYTILLAPMLLDGRLVGVLSVEKMEPYTSYSLEEISLVKAIAKFMLLVIERDRIQREWSVAHASEMTLREANRRFDEFLSIASHELRTPLAGIKGNIQLALRRLAALRSDKLPEMHVLLERLEKMQDFLSEAESRVNVQNRMISDLLDVSRIQANKLELVMGPCDLSEIVRRAVQDQRYATPGRVITLKLFGTEGFMVIGDADRLGQVVHNYLSNALKYSPAEQPVSVSLEQMGDNVRVAVSDRGPGLTPEEQKHVWERFYRVKGIPAQGNAGPGLGLGLHICRTIIEAHQGSFGLESAPGQGSIFWFSLPLERAITSAPGQPSDMLQQST